jgi:hypothetical protein
MSSTSKTPTIPRDVPFRYYMGWDSHEIIAHEIASLTCREFASVPVVIHPLQNHVRHTSTIVSFVRSLSFVCAVAIVLRCV